MVGGARSPRQVGFLSLDGECSDDGPWAYAVFEEVILLPPIDHAEFVTSVQPLLAGQDLPGLLALLKSRWSIGEITGMLACECDDARKVAALALSLVGSKRCIEPLARQLAHADPMVNEMAEHALWSIWFRCGSPEANQELCRGSQALNGRNFTDAEAHFTRALEFTPEFAEAYNQRAIAHYLQEQFDESIEDCLKTVEFMPCHFGAWAGMGHCHAHEGRLSEAAACYDKALAVNPHMHCVSEALAELRARLND